MKQYLLATALLLTASANAVEIPNVFQSGGTAKASEVNENFTVLKDALNALSASSETKTTYNAADYLPTTNMLKLFGYDNRLDENGQPLEEEVTIITDNGDGKTYQYINEPLSDPLSQDGVFLRLDFSLNSQGYFYKGYHRIAMMDFLDAPNTVVDKRKSYEPGNIRFPNTFSIGDVFANDSTTVFDQDGFGKNLENSVSVGKGMIVGVSDVQVPAGNYQGCLKVLQETVSMMRIRYYCPGVGVVKVVTSTTSGGTTKFLKEIDTGTLAQETIASIPDYVLN